MTSKDIIKACSVCFHYENVKYCGNCKSRAYCSEKCQKEDWKNHKKVCVTIAKPMTNKGREIINQFYKGQFQSFLSVFALVHPKSRLDVYPYEYLPNELKPILDIMHNFNKEECIGKNIGLFFNTIKFDRTVAENMYQLEIRGFINCDDNINMSIAGYPRAADIMKYLPIISEINAKYSNCVLVGGDKPFVSVDGKKYMM